MKILYYDLNMPYLLKDTEYPIGGATVQWFSWIKGFVANNHQVGVLTWAGAESYIGKSELIDMIDIVEAFNIDDYKTKIDWIIKLIPSLAIAVKRYNPDIVVQGCAGTITGSLGLVCRILRIPFVYRVANDIEADVRIRERLGLLQRIAFICGLFSSHAIICQNEYQLQRLRQRFPRKKVEKIPNPFDASRVNVEPIRPYCEREYIAWLGVFQHQKNLPALVQVAKGLPQLEFRIAGKAGSSVDYETKQALATLRKLNNIKFVGYLKRSEIQEFLSQAYLLLNTSWYEGFSNTFLESLFAGTPVIAPKAVDPDGIIASNNLGYAAENYNELPIFIMSLLKMKDNEYNVLAKRCREYIIDNHDPVKLACRFLNTIC